MGEIEVRIATDNDAVETAVVKAFENEYGLTYLAAYYKLKSGMAVTADEIKEGLLKKLPEYMIPRFFVELESFPLNPSGKIDRKSIAAPDAASFKAEYIAPQNELQEKLCSAFEKILKCGRVGIRDDFFAMAVSAEELAVNAAKYAYQVDNDIDICLRILDDKLVLRFRDNGRIFNPTEFIDDSGEEITGLSLVRTLTPDIYYNRVLGFNVTTVTVPC